MLYILVWIGGVLPCVPVNCLTGAGSNEWERSRVLHATHSAPSSATLSLPAVQLLHRKIIRDWALVGSSVTAGFAACYAPADNYRRQTQFLVAI